eukprot:1146449-Pelagomonas_calceolata.AAC.6
MHTRTHVSAGALGRGGPCFPPIFCVLRHPPSPLIPTRGTPRPRACTAAGASSTGAACALGWGGHVRDVIIRFVGVAALDEGLLTGSQGSLQVQREKMGTICG